MLPKFRSVNFEDALNRHLDTTEKANSLNAERTAREADLERQIQDLDAKIAATYESYGVGRNQNSEQQK